MFIRNLILCCFIYSLSAFQSFQAAPRVPKEITENGLTYCTNSGGFSFNPQTADAGASMNIITEQIYDKLFDIRNHSAQLIPMLAQSYSISPDGKEIIINLRKGVKFHHTPWFTPTRDFNAEDVVFSINRMLGNNTYLPVFEPKAEQQNLQYKIFHEQVKKARFPYFESIKLNQKIKSISAINTHQVKIELFMPDSSILAHLASQYAIILSQEYAYQLNADDNLAQIDTYPVGTGSYQIKDYVYNQYVRLARNERYWRKKAAIPQIVIDLTTDRSGRLIKFFNNECQIASYPEISLLGLLNGNNERYYVHSTEGMNLAYLAFNFKKPSMRDIKLRQAISHAINRHRLVKNIYHNTATVANNIIPSISWAATVNTPDFDYDYNLEQAKALLENRSVNLIMWVLSEEQVFDPTPIKTAQLIKQDLAKIGITLKVRSVSRTFLLEQLRNQTEEYHLILAGWLTGNLDPDSFMRPILSCGAQNDVTNLSNWCNQDFDHFMDIALTTTNLRERAKAYHSAQEIVLNQLPIMPIANVKRVLVSNAKVKGVEITPFGSLNFSLLHFNKEKK
ncbi:ABC transporter substrate-binding protein [Rodentibacter caecimuris]|uniref:ABC transporter substrate-binding protein n=1 Tax=Rodentibacter caecimuris TaxID=1796644 RepID=A0ABX3KZH7_9PAST|nr:ABC transporter substrate-binding protein [Rodentibacter heylii]